MKPLPPQPCCCHPTKRPTPHPTRHLSITLLTAVIWFFIPKCPMCLAAYVFAFTGASLTFSTSTLTYKLLLTFIAAIFFYSVFQLTIHFWNRKNFPSSSSSDGSFIQEP